MTGEERIRLQDAKALLLGSLAILGIIIFVIIMIFVSRKIKKKKYTALVIAEVEKMDTIITTFGSEGNRAKVPMHAPIMKFELNGQTYRTKNNSHESNVHFETGQRVEILIDPSNPTDGYLLSDKEFMKLNGFPTKD
jgi:preprotein translocase subunit YajC